MTYFKKSTLVKTCWKITYGLFDIPKLIKLKDEIEEILEAESQKEMMKSMTFNNMDKVNFDKSMKFDNTMIPVNKNVSGKQSIKILKKLMLLNIK